MSGICPNGGTTNYISTVSTLTGPEGPVLPEPPPVLGAYPRSFNPHRARRPGATRATAAHTQVPRCFNPHRARRPGATSQRHSGSNAAGSFQSSPGPEARCYDSRARATSNGKVSILTGPGGPVLLGAARHIGRCSPVSILTGPGGPVLRHDGAVYLDLADVSILTGPGGPVLPGSTHADWHRHAVSILTGPGGPVLQTQQGGTTQHNDVVSILTGPGGPVLLRRARITPW